MEVSGRSASSVDGVDQSASDQLHKFCQPCAVDGPRQNAHGYCTDCDEYLCKDCFKVHRNSKATRSHVCVNLADMPHGEAPSTEASDVLEDKLTELCTVHADENIKYYCKTHNKTACTVCVTLSHRSCKDVQYIPDIAAGTSDSRECKDLPPELKALKDKLTNMEFQAGESLEAVEKASDAYSQQVQMYRDQLMAIIDKLAAEAEDKKKTYVDKWITQLNSIRKVSQDRRHNINVVTSQINDRRLAVQEKMLFVLLKHADNLATDCQNYITSVENNVSASRIEFKNNTNLLDMLSNVGSLGDTVTSIQSNVGSLGDTVTSMQSNVGSLGDDVTSIQPTGEIKVQAASEDKYFIADLHILSDGRLIVTDWKNKSVKLFDRNHRLKSRVQLQSKPWSIAEVSSGDVAVLLPNSQTIQFLSISGDLNPGRTINTDCSPRRMAISGDIIILLTTEADTSGPCIVRLDLNGRKLQTPDIGSVIDSSLYYTCIRIHPTSNNIYASHDGGGVTCMTQRGKLVAEYKDAELQDARGLAIHPDGSVYVCGFGSNNIHHITAECKIIDVILGHGEIKKPWPIGFDQEGKLLYVGEAELYSNKLKVFRLGMFL